MTIQVQDFLLVDGEFRRIAAAAPVPFAPNAYGLHFGGMLATNCYRGFSVRYELDGDTFIMNELRLAVDVKDLGALINGKLFGRSPSEITGLSLTYRSISLPYSGKLLVDASRGSAKVAPPKSLKEVFSFSNGRLMSRRESELFELPEEFTPSSVWIDYGVMLWILPDQTELEAT